MAHESLVILNKGLPTSSRGILFGNSKHVNLLYKYIRLGSLGTSTLVVTNIGGNFICCKALCLTSTDTQVPSNAFLILESKKDQQLWVASSKNPTLPSNNGISQK